MLRKSLLALEINSVFLTRDRIKQLEMELENMQGNVVRSHGRR